MRMKNKIIVAFNSYDFGSTGNLCSSLLDYARKNGFRTFFIADNKRKNNSADYYIREHTTRLSIFLTNKKRQIFGFSKHDSSIFKTKKVISVLNKILHENDYVVFHFHNVQFMNINIFKIIEFAHLHNIKIVWTLHDCWPFTGGCYYFSHIKCNGWKDGSACKGGPRGKKCKHNEYVVKRNIINSYSEGITFVSPSFWLDSLVGESFITSNHLIIHNGIKVDNNTSSVKVNKQKDVIKLISVASPWDERKGLKYINELAAILPNNYSLVVVGLTDNEPTHKRIIRMPKLNKDKLFSLYMQCDIFINPTLDDNFPTVNIEALLFGLPVVSFKTGGSCEIFDENTGACVEEINAFALLNAILNIQVDDHLRRLCIKRGELFSVENYCNKYLHLFEKLLKEVDYD